MKLKKIQYWSLLLLLVLLVSACKPEELILEPAPSKLEGINGTFSLTEVIQIDPLILGSGNSLDVTRVFTTGAVPTISFNSDAFTFTFVPGDGPNYLGAGGTWTFDNNDYPTQINMDNGQGPYVLKLRRTIRPQDQFLEVDYERNCGGNATVVYQFKFARNN